jgi:hypothetical protein
MIKRKDAISRTDKTLRLMRCLEEIIDSFSSVKLAPKGICFQRSKVYYKLLSQNPNSSSTNQSQLPSSLVAHHHHSQESNVYLFDSPVENSDIYFSILNNFEYLNSDHVIDRNMIEYLVTNSCVRINNMGKWILVTKIKVKFKY